MQTSVIPAYIQEGRGRRRNLPPPPQKPRGQLAWHIQWKITRNPVSNKGESEDQHPRLSSALHMCYIYTLAHVHTCWHSHIYRVHTHTTGIASIWFMEWNYRNSRDSRDGFFVSFYVGAYTYVCVNATMNLSICYVVQKWNSGFMLGTSLHFLLNEKQFGVSYNFTYKN